MRFDLEEHPARRRVTQWPHRIAVKKPASQTVHSHATDELAVNNSMVFLPIGIAASIQRNTRAVKGTSLREKPQWNCEFEW